MIQPTIELKAVRKVYGEVVAVQDVSLTVAQGELVALVGPSGCGKTSILRCIAGLESIDGGEIRLYGQTVAGPSTFVPPEHRRIGMIFQSYAVWPHMTVFDNVAYGLRVRKVPVNEITDSVNGALNLVGLYEYRHRLGTELSGGQQQRVAFARSVVTQPRVLLFDEPLSNLDAKLRERMRFEIRSLQRRLGISAVYVTHDQGEAMAVSDRIVLMNGGVVVQEGTGPDLYRRPETVFTADFIGFSNFISGTMAGVQGDSIVVNANGYALHAHLRKADFVLDKPCVIAFRPEAVSLAEDQGAGPNTWKVNIVSVSYLGATLDVRVQRPGTSEVIRMTSASEEFEKLRDLSECWISVDPRDMLILLA